MSIPFTSLQAITAQTDPAAAVERVLASGTYILGPEVERFERDFADVCGVRHGVGVANGTDALEIALSALDIGPGDRVATVANAGPYATTAIRALGAEPVFVDVDPDSLTMAPEAFADAVRAERLAAVVVTHLYGRLADLDPLTATADDAGIPVIEDCAQAHGAERDGHRAGARGRIGCFSFYPTKNLPAIGDGGAIVTDDPGLEAKARALRQYGWGAKYRTTMAGGRNSRLDELQAAVLNDRLPFLEGWNRTRRAVADRYLEELADLPLTLPPKGDADDVAHLFVVRADDRDRFQEHLAGAGVGSAIHYPYAEHLLAAELSFGTPPSLPVTESACSKVLSLPCHPGLSADEQHTVIMAVRSCYV